MVVATAGIEEIGAIAVTVAAVADTSAVNSFFAGRAGTSRPVWFRNTAVLFVAGQSGREVPLQESVELVAVLRSRRHAEIFFQGMAGETCLAVNRSSAAVYFFRIFAVLFTFAPWACLGAEGEIRVAVLAEDEPNLEALVLARLGERENLVLFGRTEIPALERELRNALAGGELRLSGVERLVVIARTGDSLAVRVTDCSTGAVLYEANLPPKLTTEAAAEMLARRLPAQLERSPREDAVRVALLGFRFPVSSAENRSLESRLNLACAVALQNSRDAVVLERWRMKDLVFESTLREEAIGSFWNSAVMVQGAVVTDGEKLTVTLEVKNPGGGSPRTERVEGRVADLPELGARLAAFVLKIPPTPFASSRSEAEAYLAEADWLLAHQLHTEAVQAAECAVALDPGNRDAEVRRIQAYSMGACGDDLLVRKFYAEYGHAGAIKRENVGRSVAFAAEMSRLVEDYLAEYSGYVEDTLEDPVSLGIRTLLTSLRTLTAAYEYDYFLTDADGVEALRASAERTGRLLRERTRAILRCNVDLYLTNYAGYWCATPEAAIEEYRSSLSRDFESGFSNSWPAALRISLVKTSGNNPPLLDVDPGNRRAARPEHVVCRMVAWIPGDETKVRDLWEAYLDELSASDDLLKQADALYFRWGSQSSFANREKTLGAILDFLEKHPDSMLGKDGRAIAQMLVAPLRHLSSVQDGNLCVRYLEVLVKLFEQDAILPYEMVQMLPQTFGYRRNDESLLTELARLVEVMERHQSQWEGGKDRYYLGMLTYALSGLRGVAAKSVPKREIPLGGTTTSPPLKVTRLWPQQRYLKDGGLLNGNSGAWFDGALWFSQRTPLGFWKVDPVTFKTERFDSPEPPQGISGPNGNSHPFFRDGRIFLSAGRDVWSFDPAGRSWRGVGMPAAEYFLFEANGALWAIFGKGPFGGSRKGEDQGTGLYRIDTKTLTGALAFSTRRRPVENPLDSLDIGAPVAVFSGSDGYPVVGLVSHNWKFVSLKDGRPWPFARPKMSQWVHVRPEGALVVQRSLKPVRGRKTPLFESLVSVDPEGRAELLFWEPDSPDAGVESELGRPLWRAPDSLSLSPENGSRYISPLLLGSRLIVLVADVEGSTEDFTSAVELFVFERGRAEAIQIPLRFEVAADAAPYLKNARHDMTKRAVNPRPIWNNFFGNSQGFVYAGEWGFWFIPMADFERALADAAKKTAVK